MCLQSVIFYFLRHIYGENSTSIGYISSLPTSIEIDNTILDSTEKSAKFPTGPIIGPMLFMVDITDVAVVEKSLLSRLTISIASAMNIRYAVRYASTPWRTSALTSLPSAFIEYTLLGLIALRTA